MVVNIDIREYLAELMSYSQYDTQGVVRGFSARDWRDVIDAAARDIICELGEWKKNTNHCINMLNHHIFRLGFAERTGWNIGDPDDRVDPGEYVFEERLDSIVLEMDAQLRGYIARQAIWSCYTHRDHVSVSYVGDGATIERAIRASGGNFNLFLEQFF